MAKKTQKSKKEIAKEITEQMKQAEAISTLEDLVKRNVIEWELDGTRYRIRMPTIKENQEIKRAKNKKYLELLNDDAYLFREQLTEQLEKKGMSINKLDNQQLQLQAQINNLQKELAKFGEQDEKNTPIITDLKLKIYQLRQEMTEISLTKRDLLAGSIEDALLEFEATYSAYLLLEKLEGDKWVRVFKTFEDFENSQDSKLLGITASNLALLLFGIRGESE